MSIGDASQQLIPIRTAAASIERSVHTLYRFASEGRLRLTKLGGRTYVRTEEWARFLEASTTDFVPGAKPVAGAGGPGGRSSKAS